MAMSTGSRSVLTQLGGWAFAALMTVTGLVYRQDLKALVYNSVGHSPADMARGERPARISDRAEPSRSSSSVELRVGHNGHFITDAEVNGRSISVMVDTGASTVALTWRDADRIGVRPTPADFTHRVNTANGVAKVAPVMLDRVAIGNVMVRNVQAVVIEDGKLTTTLLGNSFLSKLSRYEMRSGRLVLEE
jgi:aspartyl protease family protein